MEFVPFRREKHYAHKGIQTKSYNMVVAPFLEELFNILLYPVIRPILTFDTDSMKIGTGYTENKVFSLSSNEIFGDGSVGPAQLPIYKQNNIYRIKKLDGSPCEWHTETCGGNLAGNVRVDSDGNKIANKLNTHSAGVSPAFCIAE